MSLFNSLEIKKPLIEKFWKMYCLFLIQLPSIVGAGKENDIENT